MSQLLPNVEAMRHIAMAVGLTKYLLDPRPADREEARTPEHEVHRTRGDRGAGDPGPRTKK
jgi:hypothetical protein